jgi:hypothetical protein
MPLIAMSEDELLALPAVIPLSVAGRALGIGRSKTSELAKAGEFPCPVLPLGRKQMVRRSELFKVIGLVEKQAAAGEPGTSTDDEQGAEPLVPVPGYVIVAVPMSASHMQLLSAIAAALNDERQQRTDT